MKLLTSLKSIRDVFKLLWSTADRHVKLNLGGTLVMVTLAAGITAGGPLLMKIIVDSAAAPSSSSSGVLGSAAVVLGLYVFSQWCARVLTELRNLMYARADRRLYTTLSELSFDHLLHLPLRWHREHPGGVVTQKLNLGLQGCQQVMQNLLYIVLPVLVEVGSMATILVTLQQSMLMVILVAAIACYAWVFGYGALRLMQRSQVATTLQAEAAGVVSEALLNYETVKYFTGESQMHQRLRDKLKRVEFEWVNAFKHRSRNGIVIATLFTACVGFTMVYAFLRVQNGTMTVGTFVMVNTYILQLILPIERLGFAFQGISQGTAFLEKLLEFLREPREPKYGDGRTGMPPGGTLQFEDVHFSYRDRQVLRGVSFIVRPGEMVGIVGHSGSGKSTLIRLLGRLDELDRGRILLDGSPISSMSASELRQSFAVVAQDCMLFNDSIRYNIAFGRPDSTQEEIEAAAKLANLHDAILRMPRGYDTPVGELGGKLSLGERQRVIIARALLRQPRIFVFDEATSNLDAATERAILDELGTVLKDRTALVIAHRLTTIMNANRIVVLEQGKMVECGTHAELLARGGVYAGLWAKQQEQQQAA